MKSIKLTRMHALTEQDLESVRKVELPSRENCQHYLRNCIAIISGYTQLLAEKPLSPKKRKEYGKAIEESLEDILQFLTAYEVI